MEMRFWTLSNFIFLLLLTLFLGCKNEVGFQNYNAHSIVYEGTEFVFEKTDADSIIFELSNSKKTSAIIKSFNKYKLKLTPKKNLKSNDTVNIILYGGFKYFLFESNIFASNKIILPKKILEELHKKNKKSLL